MELYGKLLRASVRSQMEYKFSFLTEMLMFMVLQALDFLLVAAILLRFDKVGGWNLYEIGYLFALSSMVRSIYRIFGNEIHQFDRYVLEGEFDQLLTRPVSPLLLLAVRNIHWNQIGGFVQGVLMLAFCFAGMAGQGVQVWPAVAYLPVALLSGAAIAFALGIVTATAAFWIGKTQELQALTHYGPFNASGYPMHIYPGWLKMILFTLLPVAFFTYVPALYLFGKGGSGWMLVWPPLVAMAALGVALWFWSFGIKRYQSTGS